MSLSRSFNLLKNVISSSRNMNLVRHSSDDVWVYRRSTAEYVPKYTERMRDLMMGATFYWMFWHLYHDWGHIVGEYEYPDPSKWTDAELGIPPDDEE